MVNESLGCSYETVAHNIVKKVEAFYQKFKYKIEVCGFIFRGIFLLTSLDSLCVSLYLLIFVASRGLFRPTSQVLGSLSEFKWQAL